MAKNKRKALSAIDKNTVKCHALNSKPLKSNRVNSKARASDVFEPRSKRGIPYVQIMKDPKNTLYKAVIDERTNGIYFYPSSHSKTPMAFDKKRHVIVYSDTPQTSCAVGTIESEAVKGHEEESSPSNSSSSNIDNCSDDDSVMVGDDVRNLKVDPGKKQSGSTSVNVSWKRTDASMKGIQNSGFQGRRVDDDDECFASPSSKMSNYKGGKNNRENTREAVSFQFCNIPENVTSSYQADWRTTGAIDY